MSATRTIPDGELLTPRVRTVGRRLLFWIGIGTVVVLLLAVVATLTRSSASGIELDPEDAAPTGSRALANVLEQRGVDVVPAGRIEDVVAASAGRPDETTVLVVDPDGLVDDHRVDELRRVADRIVFVQPRVLVLDALVPELAVAEFEERGVVEAGEGCDIPAAQRAGSIVADGTSYELVEEAPDVTLCFAEDGVAPVAQVERGGDTVTITGAISAFTNAEIARAGTAAFAIGLLGQTETLAWYMPDASDAGGGPADPTALLPPWASPVAVLLALVGVLAAMWRGRRLGPLVIENLPVVVPASETMEGRARLYSRSAARLHALDALRIGTIGRIAALCGLPRSADVGAVSDAAAIATGRDLRAVRDLLVDATPGDDGDLVRRSDDLLELERAVQRAVRPS